MRIGYRWEIYVWGQAKPHVAVKLAERPRMAYLDHRSGFPIFDDAAISANTCKEAPWGQGLEMFAFKEFKVLKMYLMPSRKCKLDVVCFSSFFCRLFKWVSENICISVREPIQYLLMAFRAPVIVVFDSYIKLSAIVDPNTVYLKPWYQCFFISSKGNGH